MRNTNIISSIANVISRFSVQGTPMSDANDPRQHRHLTTCLWPISNRDFRADLLFWNLSMATAGINGKSMPISSERPAQKQPWYLGQIQQLFQRLS